MICSVCRDGLEGIWDPKKTKRLGLLRDFSEILQFLYPEVENPEDFDAILSRDRQLEPERYVFAHHPDYDSLLRSRKAGCVGCKEFSELNDRDDENACFKALGYYSVFMVEMSKRNSRGTAAPEMMVFSGEDLEYFFHVLVPHDSDDELNSDISTTTSGTATWLMVESWLGKCIETHSECCDSSDERFLPTRLLELRVIDGQRTFRLVDSWSNPSLSDRYVTLSHCWGSGPVEEKLRLLVSTEPQLRNGLPVSTLPKTFREAFEIIERLKIRYLWIDRLCIIQDSSDDLDWRKEASKMQAVYWNSVLSIAALGASDDQDGCFFTRNPAEVAPTVIRLVDNDRGHVSLYRFHEEKDAWEVGFKEGPILSRAWVVQERALAARILYFGRTQVFWECYEARCCETNPGLVRIDGRHKPSTLVRRYPSASYKLLRDKLDNNSRNTERTNTHVQLLNNWASIVGIYSTCSLARSTDKLIALSGLAHHIRNSLLQLHPSFGTYLAGIWKHTLPLSLLWRRKGPTCRPPSYQAPSWSWASIDGGVTFPVFSESAGHYIEMSSAQVVPQGDDPTGAVTDGVLTLLGRLCKSAISPKRDAKDFRDLGYARILSFYAADSGEHMEVGGGGTISFDATSDACDEVYFLPIFGRALNGVAAFEISGLALMEIEGPRNSYRRVGYVWFWIEDGLDAEGPVPKVLSLITPDIVTIK